MNHIGMNWTVNISMVRHLSPSDTRFLVQKKDLFIRDSFIDCMQEAVPNSKLFCLVGFFHSLFETEKREGGRKLKNIKCTGRACGTSWIFRRFLRIFTRHPCIWIRWALVT